MVFPIVMYRCESWTTQKAECWRTDVFELWCWRRLESPLEFKEIKPTNPKGNKAWIFLGKTDAGAGAPIFWPPDVKSQLIGKDFDAGNDWRQEVKGATEGEFVGWHRRLNGHAVAAAKSLQSCLTLWPHRLQPTRLLCPWDSPGKNTGVGQWTWSEQIVGDSEGQGSLACYSPWGCKGSDTSQWLNNNQLVSLPGFFRFTVRLPLRLFLFL